MKSKSKHKAIRLLLDLQLPPSKRTITDEFERFHTANPWLYEELCRLARLWKKNTGRCCNISMLWENVRFNHGIKALANPGDEWCLNNNYRSRYARMIMDNEPDLKGMFRTRRLRSE